MVGSLEGVRVLELARYQAGPRGGMILSDLGAEVIKIEKLGGEETRRSEPLVRGQSVYFSVYNRGKKSLSLDMRTPRGKVTTRSFLTVTGTFGCSPSQTSASSTLSPAANSL